MGEMDEVDAGVCAITHLRHAVPDPLEIFFVSVAAIRDTGGAMMACVPAPHGHYVALMSAPYPSSGCGERLARMRTHRERTWRNSAVKAACILLAAVWFCTVQARAAETIGKAYRVAATVVQGLPG
jgi:hypothetical protein